MAALGNPPKRIKPRSFRVGFFNTNGIKGQRAELIDFVRCHNLDVFLIQETFLKPHMRTPKLPNYRSVRNDRTTGSLGGTLIYFKNALHCIPLDPPEGLSNIEVSVCRLSMTGHLPITIISAYLSPLKELHSNELKTLLDMGESVLLAGDLNAKNSQWHCNITNSRGSMLSISQELLGFELLVPSEPTHYSRINDTFRADILDLALVRNVSLGVHSLQVHQELDSDHRPVIIDFAPINGPHDAGPNVPMRVKTNWRLLGSKLADTSSPLLSTIPTAIETPEEASEAVRSLTNHLQNVVSECSERVPATDFGHWDLPEDVRWWVRKRNAALRACAADPAPDQRRQARFLQREAKRRVQEAIDQRWESHLSEIKPSHQALWQLTRSFRRTDQVTMPPLDRPNQRPAFEDEEKAELLADSLESQCSLASVPVDTEHLVAVNNYVESRNTPLPPPSSLNQLNQSESSPRSRSRLNTADPDVDSLSDLPDPLSPVTLDEVKDQIKALKKRKAPGGDGISARVLKMLPEHFLIILTAIFNVFLQNGHFPQVWKEAIVIGIHKPGKPASAASSYRPISLLSVLGKMYERIVLARLRIVARRNHLLPEEQFGFRARHSCVNQVLRITEHIHDKFTRGISTGALFFDVEKAFDKVWHNGLLYKLYNFNVPTQLVHIIRDFLSNRGFRYRVEGTLSSRRTLTAGVPQGSALSPFLFSLYTSDIPKLKDAHLALFADDTAVYSSGRKLDSVISTLQKAADTLGAWFAKWRITINPVKSQAIFFSRLGRVKVPHYPSISIRMANQAIPWLTNVKYLGVILDRKLSFTSHIKAVRARAAFAMGQLHWLTNKTSKLSIRNKIRIYTACIRPIMTYASPAFAHVPSHRWKCMQVLQNVFLRRMFGSPWYVRNRNTHLDSDMPTIGHVLRMASRRYFDRAAHHPNPLVRKASLYTPFDRAKWRRPRSVLTDPEDEITLALKNKHEQLKLLHCTRPLFRPRRRGPRRAPHPPDPQNSSGPRADN